MTKFSIFNFQFSKIKILLLAIIILASILRLWQLGSVPASPDWDEAALGYNAYSLMQTDRDEYGKFLPIVLRSFDDYKPALYAYITIPSISVFGLNVFAVRLPSAILGILSVLATYFLVKELFKQYRHKEALSLLVSFFLAISPWSIQFSRVAFETNVALAFNIFAALFFLKGLKKPKLLYLSTFFAALSIYSYQSEKIFVPLLALALLIIYKKELLSMKLKNLIGPFLLGLIVMIPMFLFILNNNASLQRAKSTSIFFNQSQALRINSQKLVRDRDNNDILGLVMDNRRVVYAKEMLSGYISHFDINWLFIQGDIPRHHAPGMGILYLFELPLILIGIYALIFKEFDKKTKLMIFAWFLIAPIPASITFEVPHAVRTLNFLPTWQIFSALGLIYGYMLIKHQKVSGIKVYGKYIIYSLFAALTLFNFTYYLNQYFVQMNSYNFNDYNGSLAWQYGYKQAVSEVQSILKQKSYDKVVVSDKQPMDESYIFFLFYTKFSPLEYQNNSQNHSFGKFVFRPIDWGKDVNEKNVLYVGSPHEIPEDALILKKIYDLNGNVVMLIAGS